MGIRRENNLWRVQIQREGKRFSTTVKTEDEARAIVDKLHSDFLALRRRKTSALPQIFVDERHEKVWMDSVEKAVEDRRSWFWRIYKGMVRRHSKRQTKMDPMSPEQLKRLYIESRGRCSISGLELELPGKGKRTALTASVDRISSAYGYIAANCRIVALCVNVGMSDWGEEMFRKLCFGVVARQFL